MKELELLKRDWKKQGASLPHLGADALYAIIHKRSSSLTRWILIVAILEFAFWIGLSTYFYVQGSFAQMKELHFYEVNIVLIVLNIGILIYFIAQFYNNYKSIKTTESTKGLMQRILKVRRTVKRYVIFNISFQFISAILVFIAMVRYDPLIKGWINGTGTGGEVVSIWLIVGLLAIFLIILVLVFWFFYKLLYGILLRRLLRNYKELNKLEFKN